MQPSQQAGQQAFGDIAPKLAQLSDSVLFDDVWQRPGLTPRERSLITVAALVRATAWSRCRFICNWPNAMA